MDIFQILCLTAQDEHVNFKYIQAITFANVLTFVITGTKEVLLSCPFACLLAGLHEYYGLKLHEENNQKF